MPGLSSLIRQSGIISSSLVTKRPVGFANKKRETYRSLVARPLQTIRFRQWSELQTCAGVGVWRKGFLSQKCSPLGRQATHRQYFLICV
ncbi:hypothetical protein L596_021665 [Steinernema carpocapsae]|uniref:Uncharacterized protein n=1 Tax=Steinernema carpocapsae TaxID=34508 RepID=A0A4U5MJH4_STECR|nr:hypothetical protein L596_021665 [Steinernema carpocapsae]